MKAPLPAPPRTEQSPADPGTSDLPLPPPPKPAPWSSRSGEALLLTVFGLILLVAGGAQLGAQERERGEPWRIIQPPQSSLVGGAANGQLRSDAWVANTGVKGLSKWGGSYLRPEEFFASLSKDPDGTFSLAYDDGHAVEFDASGNKTAKARVKEARS